MKTKLHLSLAIALASTHFLSPMLAAEGIQLDELKKAYFGELHLHTSYSLDAYMGLNRVTPDAAYRFAKNGSLPTHPNVKAKLHKPLDFAAVTDHAEFYGESYVSVTPEEKLYKHPTSFKIRNETEDPVKAEENAEDVFVNVVQAGNRYGTQSQLGKLAGPQGRQNAWSVIREATDKHNAPGIFTALHAFEWSSAPNGGNLHRNVIFRDDQVPDIPFSALDSYVPEDLWDALQEYEDQGSKVLAIPHNSNYSMGMMFSGNKVDRASILEPLGGPPIDAEWAAKRAKFERAVEIMQVKQNSETAPLFSPADEFAGFEVFEIAKSSRLRHRTGWVREGLKDGLKYRRDLGVNPFKLGFAGATDTHNGTAADVEENDWVGAHGTEDNTPEIRAEGEISGWLDVLQSNPGAITGVWARANTRAEIWDALYNREIFATSGTRIQVRLFAGWDYPDNLHEQADRIQQAYANGVPMGGDLMVADSLGKTPKLMVEAMRDSAAANLDRIQIVKGWLDGEGRTREKIYNVVWAGDRELDSEGKLEPLPSTVVIADATYTNTVGSSELSTTWTDPDYDPAQRAFYYARVLEISTPRWSTYDANLMGRPTNPNVPAVIQERAWSSPIWVQP